MACLPAEAFQEMDKPPAWHLAAESGFPAWFYGAACEALTRGTRSSDSQTKSFPIQARWGKGEGLTFHVAKQSRFIFWLMGSGAAMLGVHRQQGKGSKQTKIQGLALNARTPPPHVCSALVRSFLQHLMDLFSHFCGVPRTRLLSRNVSSVEGQEVPTNNVILAR